MAHLTIKDLSKRNNMELFIEHIEKKKSFLNDRTNKKVFVGRKNKKEHEKIVEMLKTKGIEAFRYKKSMVLPTIDGGSILLTHLHKSAVFGGVKSTTHIEDRELDNLNRHIENIKKKESSLYVDIKANGKIYHITHAVSVKGTPKADWNLVDIDGNNVVFISHKDGRKATDFQQWGGVTDPIIKSHREVVNFGNDIKQMLKENDLKSFPRATTIGREIKDMKLKQMAMYGYAFKSGIEGGNINNCDLLVQGNVSLVKSNNYYVIKAHHVVNRGVIPNDKTYVPILVGMFRRGRKSFNIQDLRAGIWPAGGRRISQWI